MNEIIAKIYQKDSRRIFATLVRLLGDFDVAEEALHDAFSDALAQWGNTGVPRNPVSWLISAGKFKAIDILRRQTRYHDLLTEWTHEVTPNSYDEASYDDQTLNDDQLRLIFTCCHPAIDLKIQIPLTLREVCGLTTEEIASAYFVSATTMAQRIVRGKTKIRDANIPIEVPSPQEIPQRLDAVLAVIYLVFNESYNATTGDNVTNIVLTLEAIRLARLLNQLLPDSEVKGLLALMLLHESRRKARTNELGDIILLENQDRALWEQALIAEGTALIQQSLKSGNYGFYTLQAAISATHAHAISFEQTDWSQIVSLYSTLRQVEPTPVVELNYAIAIAMHEGAAKGLAIIENLITDGKLSKYHLLFAAKGEMLSRLGRHSEAENAYDKALALTSQVPEQRLLRRKIQQVQGQAMNK
ncbi:RNA polymerase sigma factor [Thalassotalea fusca]